MMKVSLGAILTVLFMANTASAKTDWTDIVSEVRGLVAKNHSPEENIRVISEVKDAWPTLGLSHQYLIKGIIIKNLNNFLLQTKFADDSVISAFKILIDPVFQPNDKKTSELIIKLIKSPLIYRKDFGAIYEIFADRMRSNETLSSAFQASVTKSSPDIMIAFNGRLLSYTLGSFLSDLRMKVIWNSPGGDMPYQVEEGLIGSPSDRLMALEIVKLIIDYEIPNFVTKEILALALGPGRFFDQKCDDLSREIKNLVRSTGFKPFDPVADMTQKLNERTKAQKELALKLRTQGKDAYYEADAQSLVDLTNAEVFDTNAIEGAVDLLEAAKEAGVSTTDTVENVEVLKKIAPMIQNPALKMRIDALAKTHGLAECSENLSKASNGFFLN